MYRYLFAVVCILLGNCSVIRAQYFEWARSIGGDGSDYARAVATDSAGHVYIAGSMDDNMVVQTTQGPVSLVSQGSWDIFVSKLDADGQVLWVRSMGGIMSDGATSIAVDGDGNVIIAGYFRESFDADPGLGSMILTSAGGTSEGDAFLIKLDPLGDLIWARQYGGTENDGCWAIAIDSVDNLFATGAFQGQVDLDPGPDTVMMTAVGEYDTYVSKFNANGDLLWAGQLASWTYPGSHGLALDHDGNVHIVGSFGGIGDFDPSIGNYPMTALDIGDVFVCKLEPTGVLIWAKQFACLDLAIGYDVEVDYQGSVYITGDFQGETDFDPGPGTFTLQPPTGSDQSTFICKLDVNGDHQWAVQLGGDLLDLGLGIALDAQGNVYSTGVFAGVGADFDPGPGTFLLNNSGGIRTDVFISKLDANGVFVWALQIGSPPGSDDAWDLVSTTTGGLLVCGTFEATVDLDPGAGVHMVTADSDDLYILKLSPTALAFDASFVPRLPILYPNPALDVVQLQRILAGSTVSITESTGRVLQLLHNCPSDLVLDMQPFTPGMYMVRVVSSEGSTLFKLVKQ